LNKSSAFSGVIGPDGRLVGTPLIDDEGIVYAPIDLARCIQPKQMHDIIGHYNRFDIFDLRVNRSTRNPISLINEAVRWRSAGDAAPVEMAGAEVDLDDTFPVRFAAGWRQEAKQ
jgi:aliphatic nitrilase